MKNFIREKISHCSRTQLRLSLRRVSTHEKPIFWSVGEKEVFPYVIPSQNQKESKESATILDSFDQEHQKKPEDLSSYVRGNTNLLSTCISSQFGGSDHSLASKVKLIEQLEFVTTKANIHNEKSPSSLYFYHMLYAPSCYFKNAQEIYAQESMEKLHNDLREGKSLCTLCHSSLSQKSIRLEATGSDQGNYTATGEFHAVPFAHSATHFIFIAQVQSIEATEVEDGQVSTPEWKSVVCVVEKNKNITIEKEADSPALGKFSKVSFSGVQVTAVKSFLCEPGKGMELENRTKSIMAILRSATVMGRLQALFDSMRSMCTKDCDPVEKHFLFRLATYIYALESVLHIAARETESGDLVVSAVMRITLKNALHDLLGCVESSQVNSPRIKKIRALIQQNIAIATYGESVLTLEHLLACLSLEQSACEINATSTLDMLQQRALKSLGIGKRTLLLRDAVEKVKNSTAGTKKPIWLKPFEGHLAELEWSIEAFNASTEKFLTKSGVYISDVEYQELSGCMNVQVDLFARYCVLSRAFGSLKSNTAGEHVVRFLESYCALSEANAKRHSAFFDNQKGDNQNPMQAISLDKKIFDDLVCMETLSE